MKPRTIIIVLEYDGSGFAGWQVQPGERTVQGEVESALARLTGVHHRIVAAGRTDAGVHAWGQVAHFRTDSKLELKNFEAGLNSLLPPDVAVRAASEGAAEFDARRSARGKTYRYVILNRFERSAVDRLRAWHVMAPLDVDSMKVGASYLVGEHDFSSFRGQKCASKNPVRVIKRIDILPQKEDVVIIEVEATAFLKNMVRSIVGTLVEVGRGKWSPEDVKGALDARDRTKAGPTAPPHGLYLVEVYYDE